MVQALDLDAQLGAQLGVEVGQRLVEQEHAGVAHQRPADGDALALAAGELRRPAVEQLGDLQHLRGRVRPGARSRRVGVRATLRPKDMLPRTVMRG